MPFGEARIRIAEDGHQEHIVLCFNGVRLPDSAGFHNMPSTGTSPEVKSL